MTEKRGYDTPAALYKMVPVDQALQVSSMRSETRTRTAEIHPTRLVSLTNPFLLLLGPPKVVLSEVARSKPAVDCRIDESVGHVLAEDIEAKLPIPDKPLSIMDGFAVQAGDDSARFAVVGENRAGNVDEGIVVEQGLAAYITTGSPLPRGSNAVVMIEDTAVVSGGGEEGGDTLGGPKVIEIVGGGGSAVKTMAPGQNVRQVGSDMALGEVVLVQGKVIQPADVGILASLGVSHVRVFAKPTAAFMSTGDEVVDIGSASGGAEAGSGKKKHQIFDANRPVLCACAKSLCSRVIDLGIAGDTQERLESLFSLAMEAKADVLVTSGGVSMGDSDLIKPILEQKGKVYFGKVLMKPGKPLTFATIQGAEGKGAGHKLLVFGLPGNPVSSFVTFNLVVLPALRKLGGWRDPHLRRISVKLGSDIKMDPRRPEYHRVVLTWPEVQPFAVQAAGDGHPDNGAGGGGSATVLVAQSTGFQRSSRLVSLRDACALVEVPQGSGHIPKGSIVSALLIGDLPLL